MKAAFIENFGDIKGIKIGELPVPEPKENEVQIEVKEAGINPVDWKICEGWLKDFIPHHFPLILGWDVAGKISKVGPGVVGLVPGDEVFAYIRRPTVQQGSFAEKITFEAEHVIKKPKNLSFREAAGVPLTALTAWQALHEPENLRPGSTILIQGGAGGVGGMAIQIAKLMSLKVFTTASPGKHEYVKKLGADVVIDYTKGNVDKQIKQLIPEGLDAVFDCVGGKNVVDESFKVLKKGGAFISIVENPDADLAAKYGIRTHYVFVRPEGSHLEQIAKLIDQGKIVPPEIQSYPLEKVREALEVLKKGHVKGKLVLHIA